VRSLGRPHRVPRLPEAGHAQARRFSSKRWGRGACSDGRPGRTRQEGPLHQMGRARIEVDDNELRQRRLTWRSESATKDLTRKYIRSAEIRSLPSIRTSSCVPNLVARRPSVEAIAKTVGLTVTRTASTTQGGCAGHATVGSSVARRVSFVRRRAGFAFLRRSRAATTIGGTKGADSACAATTTNTSAGVGRYATLTDPTTPKDYADLATAARRTAPGTRGWREACTILGKSGSC
jgi:hypothetical protein